MASPATPTPSPPSQPNDVNKPDASRSVSTRVRPVTSLRRKASGRKKSKDSSSSSAMPRLRLDLISSPGLMLNHCQVLCTEESCFTKFA
ncbi:hypothetical protein Bca101_043265 [Brassica carinata]